MRFPAGPAVCGFVVLTLLFHACAPRAIVNQERQQADINTELEEFFKTNNRGWAVRLSADQRRVTSLVGRRTKPYTGEPLEKATQFLKEHARLVGFDFNLNDFRAGTSRTTKFGVHVELLQLFKQLPVENGRVQINFDKEGHVVQFVSSVTPTAGAVESVTISKEQAIQAATKEFLRTTLVQHSKTDEQQKKSDTLVKQSDFELKVPPKVEDVFFAKERLRTAYKIRINAAKPFGIKEFVIDANDGNVLQTRNFVATQVDGSGQVFIPNPVNSLNDKSLRPFVLHPFKPVPTTNPNPYYTRPLLTLATAGTDCTLQGPFVVLQDIEDPQILPPTASSPFEFPFDRTKSSFEEVMVYYHISTNQLYVQGLGLGDILNRPILVDAHACFGADESQYIGEATTTLPKHILFGDGGVPDAEDGDVIIHEYAHALQDDQAPGRYSGLGYPQAMREGFGDYWAFSSFDEVTLKSGHDRFCIGEWDKVPNCVRRVDENVSGNNYDEFGDAHTNGLIWSRTLLDLYLKLGKDTTDKLILQSHFNVPDIPEVLTFELGAESVIAADMQLYYGAHIGDLCQVFQSRQIYAGGKCPSPV
jgi:hypothetical protein